MHLLKLEHPINGIWYFTSATKAAIWLNTSAPNIYTSIKHGKTVKGWSLEYVNCDDVLPQYVNPVKSENETTDLLGKVVKMLEENEKEINLLKEIASELNKKLEDTKIIIK